MACVRGRRNPGNSIEIIYRALTSTTPWRGCPFIRKGDWGCRYGEMRAWPVHRQRDRRQARRHACMAGETQATQLKLYTGRSLQKPRGVGAIHKFKRPDSAWSHPHSLRRWPLEPAGAAGPAHSRAWGDRRCVRNAAGCAALCRGMPTHMHIRKRNIPGCQLRCFFLKTIYLGAVLARMPGIVRPPLKVADFYPKITADKGLNENLQNRATTHNFVIFETREDCNKGCTWPSPSACVRRLEPGLVKHNFCASKWPLWIKVAHSAKVRSHADGGMIPDPGPNC